MSVDTVAAIMTICLLPFSVWRLSNILLREEGPFCIAQKIRCIAGVKYDDMSEPYGENVISMALSCMWCLSVWVSFFMVLMVVFLSPILSAVIIAPFGLSALSIFIDECVKDR